MKALFSEMEDHYRCLHLAKEKARSTSAAELSLFWIMSAICVVDFLMVMNRRDEEGFFFDHLHEVMKDWAGGQEWESLWKWYNLNQEFKRLKRRRRARQAKISALQEERDE